ncbi:Structural maintenance of chromosomes protein 4 [Knufia obscura]|uniref:Structural maintenance of chromosomes protein n=1 Tax=Knufia obscura TaxID=1635080 RepID=A0ABR0RPD2_9EURO|nr:Structural maintenance of chromosomes protein 4 [Knufia obscura]
MKRPAMESPVRPMRRAARKTIVLEEDSDDELSRVQEEQEQQDEEFTPAPQKKTPRKTTRRQTTANTDVSPKKSVRTRKARSGESVEPSAIFDPEGSIAPSEPASPTKTASPRKRKSTVSRATRRESVAPPTPALPTPAPSASPEATEPTKSRALADITTKALNKRPQSSQHEKATQKPQSQEAVLERPLDIALRAKAEAVAAPPVDPDTTPKARMVIRQLVMTNFKSYAGRQLVGPFHHSFSSVVGPNGSGKSNVIDSLLFVFGFRASKMRQGKISALIHNSAQHPDLDFCEVEVHFQEVIDLPGGKSEVVPDSAMVVSRKAFKNNSSNYYLNGRTTNFTTVTTLLKDRGIDLDHKRFLILQGEVESIAQMKPKAAGEHDDGLLEYLEDIIGTSKYKTPIEEAIVELESLNETCVEKQGRVQHVEKEKNGLEDKKNKAIAFIRQENELAEKQSALYQIYLAECADNAQVTDEAITQMQAQLDAELEKHAGSESSIKDLEKEYKKAAKHFDAIEKQTQDFLKELAKFDKENVKFEEKAKFIATKQKKAEKLVTSSRLAASEATSLVEKYSDDIENKTKQVHELEQDMEAEEAELGKIREDLKGKTQGISEQIAVKQKSLEPWQEKINQKESNLAVAQSELDILLERANAGQKSLDDADKRIEEIQGQQSQKEQEIEERRHQQRRLEKDCRKLNDALSKLANSEPEVRTQISSARQKAEETRASLASTQNQGNVLKGLMRLRDSGRIDGFHGRLGNLGTIDEKYDVAISTACASLENMVVDTVEVGQQCIEYLRKNNLGRANFILLDRLAKKDLSPITTPENVPRLFDLIKSKDEKFRPAFYSIMQNTLVAEDLEQANRIAYGAKRWRVVTLDGQLIDVSGTMSGGGTRIARGAMSSKQISDVSKEHVEKLEAERDELEGQFQAFLDKQRELEQTLREKQEEVPQVETSIQKVQLEIENCTRNLADAEKRRDDLASEVSTTKTDDSAIKALQKQMAGITKEIEKLHAETASVEEEIQSLQNKIMEVGGIRLRSQKGKVDSLKEQIDLLTEEISTAEVAKSKNEKLIVKHEKAKADAEKELATLARDSDKLQNDIEAQQSVARESKDRAEQAQEELEAKKEELTTMKKELDDQNTELNKTRAHEIEMRNKLEENQKILVDNQKKSRYWSEKLSKLSLHEIDDLDVPIENKPKEAANEVVLADIAEGEEEPEEAEQPSDNMDVEQQEDTVGPVQQEDSEPSLKGQLPQYTRDELEDMSKDHLVAIIAALEEKIANTSSIDLAVIAEYRRRCQDLAARTADLNIALKSRDAAKNRLTDLRTLRLTQFMTGFTTISQHLKQMYQLITLGGNAELELVDSLDPFSEGILFSVMPPKKSWKNIGNLSGGEKTLSSLALVFALHVYRPTPLYVMDEIDAALDFRNVSIIAGYIKERTKHAQFIVISLRNNMFELAERLIGIYKVNHMTKSVTVDNKDYIQR